MRSVPHTYRFAHLAVVSDLPLPELAADPPAATPSGPDHADAARAAKPAVGLGARAATSADPAGDDVVERSDPAGPTLRIALDDGSVDWDAPSRPAFTDHDADPDELLVTRRADGWGFTFRDVVQAVLDDAATTLVVAPGPSAPDDSVRHVVLDQLVPYAVDRRGDIALHAAAVDVDGVALGFLGPSGMGKSTLATALGLGGHGVLTDDCLVLTAGPIQHAAPTEPVDDEGLDDGGRPVVRAWPTYPGLRLWPTSVALAEQHGPVAQAPMAHYTSKVRAVPGTLRFADGPVPLGGLLVIDNPPDDDPDAVAVVELTGGAAVAALMASAFVLTNGSADKAATFERLAALADAVPVGRLFVPDDLARLGDVADTARSWLATHR